MTKSRDITLPTKVHLVKAVVFPTSRISLGYRPHPEVRREAREPLADKAGASSKALRKKSLECQPLNGKTVKAQYPEGFC